jgi:hypothetical protein
MYHGWTIQRISLVDWVNMETFLKTRHPIDRCNIIQSMHDWQHTGSQKSKFMPRRCSDEYGDDHKSIIHSDNRGTSQSHK